MTVTIDQPTHVLTSFKRTGAFPLDVDSISDDVTTIEPALRIRGMIVGQDGTGAAGPPGAYILLGGITDGDWVPIGTGVSGTGLVGSAANIVTAPTYLQAFGAATPNAAIVLRSAAGSSPGTATQIDSPLGSYGFAGRSTSLAWLAPTAYITAYAEETYDPTHGGSRIELAVTPSAVSRASSITPQVVGTIDSYGLTIEADFTQNAAASSHLGTELLVIANQTYDPSSGTPPAFTGVPGWPVPRAHVDLEGTFQTRMDISVTSGIQPAFQHVMFYQNESGYNAKIAGVQGFNHVPVYISASATDGGFHGPPVNFNHPGQQTGWSIAFSDGPLTGPTGTGLFDNYQQLGLYSYGFTTPGSRTRRRYGALLNDLQGQQPRATYDGSTSGHFADVTLISADTLVMSTNAVFPTADTIIVETTSGLATLSYTGKSSTTSLTGVTYVQGAGALYVGARIWVAKRAVTTYTGTPASPGITTLVATLLTTPGTLTMADTRWWPTSGTFTFESSDGTIGVVTYTGIDGNGALTNCSMTFGTGSLVAGCNVTCESGLVISQVGAVFGQLESDGATLAPYSSAVESDAMWVAGNIVCFPSNVYMTTSPFGAGFINATAAFVLDYASATMGSFMHFNAQVRLKQSANVFGLFSGFISDGTFSNANPTAGTTSGVAANLGPVTSFLARPTLQASGKTGITISNSKDFTSLATYQGVLSGTLAATSHHSFYSGLTVDTGATLTTRYGLRIDDATGAGTIIQQYGIYIEDNFDAAGTTNVGIYNGGSLEQHGDATFYGTTTIAGLSTTFFGSPIDTDTEHMAGVTIPPGVLDRWRTRAVPARTTVAGTISTTGAITMSVTSERHFPTTVPFLVQVGSEQMLVTAIGGTPTDWTVTAANRGVNGTTAATHAIGAPIQTSGQTHIFVFGDSLVVGSGASPAPLHHGFTDQLRKVLGQPSLGVGFRPLWLWYSAATEYTKAGSWTKVTDGSAIDLMPYGDTTGGLLGNQAGVWTGSANTAIFTWNRPDDVKVGMVEIVWIDYTGSTGGSYSVDGGTYIDLPAPTAPSTAQIRRTKVICTDPTTIDVKCADSGNTGKTLNFAGIIVYNKPVEFTTRGVIVHNVGRGGGALDQVCAGINPGGTRPGSGDPFRLFDGGPASLYPSLVVAEWSNDVENDDVTLWETELATFSTRMAAHGHDLLMVCPPEQDRSLSSSISGTWATVEADYRDATKSNAVANGYAVLDVYDAWTARFGTPATFAVTNDSTGNDFMHNLGGVHPTQIGYDDIGARLVRILAYDGGTSHYADQSQPLTLDGTINIVNSSGLFGVRGINAAPVMQFWRQNGTLASPAALTAGQPVSFLQYLGYNSADDVHYSGAAIRVSTEEAFTTTGHRGMRIELWTAATTTAMAAQWAFAGDGTLYGGTTISSTAITAYNWSITGAGTGAFVQVNATHIVSTTTSNLQGLTVVGDNVNPLITFNRTPSGGAALAAGVQIAQNIYSAYDGAATRTAVTIAAYNDSASAWASGDFPGRLEIFTSGPATSSAQQLNLVLDSLGALHVGTVTITSSRVAASNFVVDSTGKVWFSPSAYSAGVPTAAAATISTTGVITGTHLAATTTSNLLGLGIVGDNVNPYIQFNRTPSAAAALAAGVQIAQNVYTAYDAAATRTAVTIAAYNDSNAAWASGNFPGRLEIYTATGATGTALQRNMVLDSLGGFHVGNVTITTNRVSGAVFAVDSTGKVWFSPSAYTAGVPSAAPAFIDTTGGLRADGGVAVNVAPGTWNFKSAGTASATNAFGFQNSTTAPTSPGSNAFATVSVYKGSGGTNYYILIQWNDGGTVRYKYMLLNGTGTTWTHATTLPT